MGGSQSVDRALGLLALVGRHADRGVALSTVVAESGLNKPTARRLLLALMRSGLVVQEAETRRYYLGEEAYVLGALASHRYGLLDLAMESLTGLSRLSQDSSFLSVRRENYSVCLHREEGSYPVRTHALQVGYQHPLGAGAGSLALLSALSDCEVEQILEANRIVLAEQYPLYSPALIRKHVALTRERGWALNPGLILPNSWGIGAVIRYPDRRAAGALSIAAIDSRMGETRQKELASLLKIEIGRIEAKLQRVFSADRGGSRREHTAAAGRPRIASITTTEAERVGS